MPEFIFEGMICSYQSCDFYNILAGCKGTNEFLCVNEEMCCAAGEPQFGIGMLDKGDMMCKIGLPCCTCGLRMPRVLCLGSGQFLCMKSAASFPFHADFVPGPVLACCAIRCLPGPPGFMKPPQEGKAPAQETMAEEVKEAEKKTEEVKEEVKNEEVDYYFKIMQEKMHTRFAELRRAFRSLDEDASGSLDRDEFKQVLVMFNLGIPDRVMEKLIDLADFDGDGSINFAEFARIFTAESLFNMKQTLSAADDASGAKNRKLAQEGGKGKIDKETGENVRLRRTGPGLEKMRKAHRTLRNLILQRYPNFQACFKAIDTDNSGLCRRAELRAFLGKLSKSIPDSVISGLISYVDTDGDTKTLSFDEFQRMMSEEFLDELS